MTEDTSANTRAEQDGDQGNYRQIGAQLRKRREQLTLTQEEVARRLHLPGMVVNDIETGRVERLSGLYRRGYIRNYARLLELDADALLAEAGEDLLPALQQVMPASRRQWQFERYLKIASYVLVTTVIVPPLVYFFIAGGSRMLERDPVVADAGQQVELAVEPDPPAAASETADAGSVEQPRAGHVSASVLPVAALRPAREPNPADTLAAGAGQAPVVTASASPLSRISLELGEDSWIEIEDSQGNRLEYDLLRAGQVRSYDGLPPFRMLLGRSSAVELAIDGKPVVWDGHDSGDVARIEVSAEGEVNR